MRRLTLQKAMGEIEKFCPVIMSLLKSMLCKTLHATSNNTLSTTGPDCSVVKAFRPRPRQETNNDEVASRNDRSAALAIWSNKECTLI